MSDLRHLNNSMTQSSNIKNHWLFSTLKQVYNSYFY